MTFFCNKAHSFITPLLHSWHRRGTFAMEDILLSAGKSTVAAFIGIYYFIAVSIPG